MYTHIKILRKFGMLVIVMSKSVEFEYESGMFYAFYMKTSQYKNIFANLVL